MFILYCDANLQRIKKIGSGQPTPYPYKNCLTRVIFRHQTPNNLAIRLS